MKDKNIVKSDLGKIIQCYNIGLFFVSQTNKNIFIFHEIKPRYICYVTYGLICAGQSHLSATNAPLI